MDETLTLAGVGPMDKREALRALVDAGDRFMDNQEVYHMAAMNAYIEFLEKQLANRNTRDIEDIIYALDSIVL
jgi:hypothetical protein